MTKKRSSRKSERHRLDRILTGRLLPDQDIQELRDAKTPALKKEKHR